MKLTILFLIILSLSFANSSYENIKDEFGAYYYFSEIDKIVDETYTETQKKYTNQIQELINKIRELQSNQTTAISNVIENYDRKISIMEQKHDLELQALKIKMQLNHNKFFWIGAGLGMSATIGSVLLIDSVELPLFKVSF